MKPLVEGTGQLMSLEAGEGVKTVVWWPVSKNKRAKIYTEWTSLIEMYDVIVTSQVRECKLTQQPVRQILTSLSSWPYLFPQHPHDPMKISRVQL